MKPTKKHLTLRIAELKEAIRRKYNSFKTGAIENERLLEKQYKPIISELKKTKFRDEPDIKKEEVEEDEEEKLGFQSPPSSPIASDDGQLDSLLATPSGRDSISRHLNDHFRHPLTNKYMDLFMRDRGGKNAVIDHTFGPRYEVNTLMIGDSQIQFDNDDGDIIINKVRYKPTEGLYELLFKRMPDDDVYTENDLTAYRDILVKTNAHKKGYTSKGKINRNVSLKYRHVIEKLFPIEKKGSGMQWKSNFSRDIVHWDDPNELVDRLRLLSMSAETGNTSHANEIINIIEELREAGHIKGSGNNRFKTLLK